MKHPILLIKYKLRKPLWYMRKEVLMHRWYMGAWPDPTEFKGNYILKYGHVHSMIMVDEMNYVSPKVAEFMYHTLREGQMND